MSHGLLQAITFCWLLTLITKVTAQVNPDLARLCNSATRCNECIIANPRCVWCADPEYNGTVRCYVNGDPGFICNSLQNPVSTVVNVSTPALSDSVQVTPLLVNVTVRPGIPMTIPLSVRPARNFPVDIYLLMDLSLSMNDDLENLKLFGDELSRAVNGISSEFRVGFGSFVDKRVAPFVREGVRFLQNPCVDNSNFPNVCVSTYSYRHHVSLTPNETFFNEQVQLQNISGNQDSPEGGFDGFLQAIVCTNLIGWRSVSRKLLIYITDAGFHIAGDGKLGGIVLPHDGKCRMNGTRAPLDYNDWITLDYPSVGQVAQALRDNGIIPIFAAEARALPAYEALVRELGRGVSGSLTDNSDNIVNLVRESYNNISQRIVFNTDQVPSGVVVNINPTNCPGPVVGGICTGVLIENNATFNVVITLQECTPDNIVSRRFPIEVLGFGTFTIQLNPICNCPCELERADFSNSSNSSCNNNGTLRCGQCECNPGRFGEFCQCDATGRGGVQQMCPLGPTQVQCTSTDRGTCVCGECQCRRDQAGPLFFGPACGCDRDGCPSSNGELCSARGVCTCTGCRCNVEPITRQPYSGSACECTPNRELCFDLNNSTEVCNGKGSCGCNGRCECQEPYLGTYCEFCSGDEICFSQTCERNRDCAACTVELLDQLPLLTAADFFTNVTLNNFPNGTTFTFDTISDTFQFRLPSDYCTGNCSQNVVIINGTDNVDYMIQGEMAIRCEFTVGNCTYRYYSAFDESTQQFTDVHLEFRRFGSGCSQVVAQDLGSPLPVWFTPVVVIAALAVLGVLLALILIPLLLFIHDKFEIWKLDREIASNKMVHANCLYVSPETHHENPTYGQ
ncbi:integrin beta-1-like [Halichondria panicea]|uniref:integrin beta-1-like n=1 Tax=Halichondria panicea TaxID=6063 RepID=UPI00312BB3E4